MRKDHQSEGAPQSGDRGVVWGSGMALQEATEIDHRFGRIMNPNLQHYHVPVNALLGRSGEALPWIERAERTFVQLPDVSFDLARLALVKARALRMEHRTDEAIALAREAAATFRELDERQRHADARVTEAALLYDSGSVQAALDVCNSVRGERHLDRIVRSRCEHTIAMCSRELGHPQEALDPLRRCVATFEQAGLRVERTHSRWALGTVLFATGANEEAVRTLQRTCNELVAMDLFVDAALAGLDLAELFIVTRRSEHIPSLCQEAAVELLRVGAPHAAVAALTSLRDAAGRASRKMVRETHATVKRIIRDARRGDGTRRTSGSSRDRYAGLW